MRRVVITGGSRGIGAATVRRFTAAGDQVYFLYEKSTELARQLEQETGAVGIPCDISQEDAVNRAFQQIGPVDVLVNNAGIVDYNPINWVSAETFRRVMDVNVTGMFLCCKAALSGMLQQQKGAIVNVSSMWGRAGALGDPGQCRCPRGNPDGYGEKRRSRGHGGTAAGNAPGAAGQAGAGGGCHLVPGIGAGELCYGNSAGCQWRICYVT